MTGESTQDVSQPTPLVRCYPAITAQLLSAVPFETRRQGSLSEYMELPVLAPRPPSLRE